MFTHKNFDKCCWLLFVLCLTMLGGVMFYHYIVDTIVPNVVR